MAFLDASKLSFQYDVAGRRVEVLKELDFLVAQGEFVAILGPSGSGKSTLFYLLGGLLKPSAGSIHLAGSEITRMSEPEQAELRRSQIGFVFQQFHLLPRANVLENILLAGQSPAVAVRERAIALATQMGLEKHLHHMPNQLSGGQQQRVAIARALLNDAKLILADEPTGNLDSATAKQVMDLLVDLNRQGTTIILITHDREVASYCSKIYSMRDGAFTKVEEGDRNGNSISAAAANPSVSTLPSSDTMFREAARSSLRAVGENLKRNRMRSLLTMLGVTIGVGAVFSVVTLGQYAKRKVLEGYEEMGVNRMQFRGYRNPRLKASDSVPVQFYSFDWEKDVLPMAAVFPEVAQVSPSLFSFNNLASRAGRSVSEGIRLYGVNESLLEITNRKLLMGEGISPHHVGAANQVCVIGFDVAKELFPDMDAVGELILITAEGSPLSCRVIGVLTKKNTGNDLFRPNLHVFIPFTYFRSALPPDITVIRHLVIQVRKGNDVDETGAKLSAYFAQKYGRSGVFVGDSDTALLAQFKRFLNIFGVLLVSVAGLSLLVGGIGISNMMLMSVTDRLKEFGLRKALGATNQAIRFQVLTESVILCTVAGAAGIVGGFFLYEIVVFGAAQFFPEVRFEWLLEPSAFFLALAAIPVVAIVSGFTPALKAERLSVIEALRSE